MLCGDQLEFIPAVFCHSRVRVLCIWMLIYVNSLGHSE